MTITGSSPSKALETAIKTERRVCHTEAAVLFKAGDVRVVKLAIPELKPGQVLVEVAYSGICGSQLLEIRGERGEERFLPHTLGHEGSGIVLEIGEGVTKVKPGDHVVLSWMKGHGAEIFSTVYEGPDGPVNSGPVSTWMRETVTCENRVTPVPTEMPLAEAALLGCAVPTGMGAALRAAQVKRGSSVAVFGAGGIGLSAVMAARLAGASTVIALDLVTERLQMAMKLGATHEINVLGQNPVEAVFEITEGSGVDYAIEASGRKEAMESAFAVVRERGGLCVLAGNLPHGEKITLDPFEFIRGKQIKGTWGGDTIPDRDFLAYAELYLSGQLRLEELCQRRYRLENINEAIQNAEQGKGIRILMEMRGRE